MRDQAGGKGRTLICSFKRRELQRKKGFFLASGGSEKRQSGGFSVHKEEGVLGW